VASGERSGVFVFVFAPAFLCLARCFRSARAVSFLFEASVFVPSFFPDMAHIKTTASPNSAHAGSRFSLSFMASSLVNPDSPPRSTRSCCRRFRNRAMVLPVLGRPTLPSAGDADGEDSELRGAHASASDGVSTSTREESRLCSP
jgi:hypothetical protein